MGIQNVCVLGIGNMGRQIAADAARNGFTVKGLAFFEEELKSAKEWLEKFVNREQEKNRMSEEEASNIKSKLNFTMNLEEAVEGSDLIIESIVENLDTKKDTIKKIRPFTTEQTIIVSNSSYIPSSNFVDDVKNSSNLANFHYFNPVARMKLIEIVKGPHTSEETFDSLQKFAKDIKKETVLIYKEIEGFIVNRILRAVQDEAFYLYENGYASYEDIDKAAEIGLNYPMGPFRLLDFTGIDINYLNRQKKFEETGNEEDRPPEFLKEKYEKGELGRKTGKGWYDYGKN